MERMSEEEFINNVEGHITSLKNLDNKALKILVSKLEEENKDLKEWKENLIRADKKKSDHIDELEEENKKLNEEIQRFKDNAMQDMREITELEIENKKLKEELDKLKSTYVYDAKQVRDIC